MREKLHVICYILAPVFLSLFGNVFAAQQAEAPRVTAVEPDRGVTTPGTKVTVVGAHFSSDSIVYFGGLQAREVTFLNSSALQAVTPYLRPGRYKIDIKSGQGVVRSEVGFTAVPAPVDTDIDGAEDLAAKKQTADAAIGIFTSIATSQPDYDVRAYVRYRAAQLYLQKGDYWAAGEQAALFDRRVSMGVQSSWRYRLLTDEITYSVSENNDRDADLKVADWDVKWDVTENPQPRFWRSLISARFGKMEQAKADLKFVLVAEPENPSYRSLAAYINVLTGQKTKLEDFGGPQVKDEHALALLGQAAYLSGDYREAQALWARQAEIGVAQGKLDCGAGRKHLAYGQTRVGTALIAECAAVTPNSREGKQAKEQLAELESPVH
jgi:tetratricopeptide (TPR) repeat protein